MTSADQRERESSPFPAIDHMLLVDTNCQTSVGDTAIVNGFYTILKLISS